MGDIKGIIFDCDGVLADTATIHYEGWQHLANEEGVSFSRKDYLRMSGTTRQENLRLFTEGLNLDEETKRAWLARKVAYVDARLAQLTPDDALPGVTRLMDEARSFGLKIGLGSASANARQIIERLQITHRFDAIGDGYTVTNSKPAPDIFIWVAGGLGLKPTECVVIEDSRAGVQAARTGGFYVVGVGSGLVDDAHLVLPTLATISLAEMLEHVIAEDM